MRAARAESIGTDDRPWYVYLLECRDGSVYVGVTPDLVRRMRAHRAGTGAKYTRSRPPQHLLGAKRFACKRAAMAMEYEVKQRSRTAKLALAAEWSAVETVEDREAIAAARAG
jgi:putative endonuclease